MSKYINVIDLNNYIKAWCNLDAYYNGKQPKNIPIKELEDIIDRVPKEEIESGKLKGYIKTDKLKGLFNTSLSSDFPETRILLKGVYKYVSEIIDEALEREEAKDER